MSKLAFSINYHHIQRDNVFAILVYPAESVKGLKYNYSNQNMSRSCLHVL